MNRKLYENIMYNVSKEVKKVLNEISDEALLMAAGAAKHKANNASSEEERNYEMKRYNNFLNYAHNPNRYGNSGNTDPISILRRLGELANANGNENTIKQKTPNDDLPDGVTPEMLIVYAMKNHQKIQVQNKEHLMDLINRSVQLFGLKVDLSFVDTSMVTDMSELFMGSNFAGNISEWDVSHVTDMQCMFANSTFNGDISGWDVSNVINMGGMFANSFFDGDISKWDVSNVIDMKQMFEESIFDGNISKWNVSNVRNMARMFKSSAFNGNISKWNVWNVMNFQEMFSDSRFTGDISKWKMNPKAKRTRMKNIGWN